MIRKAIYKIGVFFRNNLIFDKYNFLIKSQYWDIKEIQVYQYKKLKELLNYAYNNSKYYRDKYTIKNFHPDQINSLSDLKKIPIVTKYEVLNNAQNIQIKDFPEKLIYSETSGSTGEPLVFYRNIDWDAWHNASVYRGYSWYGVKPWEKKGYFWGYNFSLKQQLKTKILDYLQNRFRLFSYSDSEINKFVKKLKKASYLEGYSSMIYEVAKKLNENSLGKPEFNLKMIKGTSERIFDKYQDEVKRTFGRKIISEYGAAEAGIIAFECPQGNMHINMETVIVEEIENEIVVTNLVSKSFPIIRYKLGDYIEVEQYTKCKCGMSHWIIKEVMGRVGKVIYGRIHQYPSLTLYYVFKNLAIERKIILNYRAIQYKKGFLEINIEQSLKKKEKDLLIKEFIKYFGKDLRIEITGGVDLISCDKKKADFTSYINDTENKVKSNL